jgi:16S rRNA (uracil1498-N3)-methyltransferase
VNLILLERSEVSDGGEVTLADQRAAHMLTVLGVTAGSEVRIGLLDGERGSATVAGIDGATVTLRCAFDGRRPPRPPLDLLLALPRPKVMRRLWAQLAALGVGRIILTNAERVERNYFDTHVLSEPFYRPLLIEGLQQCRDTRLPLVSVHRRLKVLVEDDLDRLAAGSARVMADPAAPESIGDVVPRHPGRRVLLAVGPEGGWSRFEAALLARHGFEAVGMGPRTLRTDTACVALLALAHDAWLRAAGDPRPA